MAKKNKFKQVLQVYQDFQKLSVEEIQVEMKDVIQKHGASAVAEGTELSSHALYRYCKAVFLSKGLKPDFISYCKVMLFGDEKGRLSDGKK